MRPLEQFEDFSGRTCSLDKKPETWVGESGTVYHDNDMPMYSYTHPSAHFWNGVANYLRDKGLTDQQIQWTLGHKYMRWLLDGHSEKLDVLGYQLAEKFFNNEKPQDMPEPWE